MIIRSFHWKLFQGHLQTHHLWLHNKSVQPADQKTSETQIGTIKAWVLTCHKTLITVEESDSIDKVISQSRKVNGCQEILCYMQ